MRPAGMHQLKTTLVGVILVYLVVDFATDWAEGGAVESWTALVKPISILLIAGALRLWRCPSRATPRSTKRAAGTSARRRGQGARSL